MEWLVLLLSIFNAIIIKLKSFIAFLSKLLQILNFPTLSTLPHATGTRLGTRLGINFSIFGPAVPRK